MLKFIRRILTDNREAIQVIEALFMMYQGRIGKAIKKIGLILGF